MADALVVELAGTPLSVRLAAGGALSIGSDPGADLFIDDPALELRHLELRSGEDGGWSLEAHAPVVLNGETVSAGTTQVRRGDELVIGELRFRLR